MIAQAWAALSAAAGAGFVGATAILGREAISYRRRSLLTRRLGNTAGAGSVIVKDDLDLPFRERIVLPMWRRITNSLGQRLVPSRVQAELGRRLRLAGMDVSPVGFQLTRLFVALALGLLGVLLAAGGFVSASDAMLVPVALAVVGYLYFGVRVNSLYQRRRLEVERNLPEAFDLLSVSVEAGLSFEAALRRAAPRLPGAAGQEFNRVVSDLELGMTRQEALKALADRTKIEELGRFASLVSQAERAGAGMAMVLHAQAARVKEVRVFKARELAALVPVKILFPMVLFILPALFVAILGGGIIGILHAFSNGF